jgi:hypothetical protein
VARNRVAVHSDVAGKERNERSIFK